MVLSDFMNLFTKILTSLVSNNLFLFACELFIVHMTILILNRLFHS